MNAKSGKKTKIIAAIAIVILVLVSVTFYLSYTHQDGIGSWTLNVLNADFSNSVTPNGTIQVSIIQDGISVTATPHGLNGFMYWLFDDKKTGDNNPTIFIPRQMPGSNHTLKAQFVIGTPVIRLIGDKQVTVNSGGYQAYKFIIPSGAGSFSDVFNATGKIQVYVMDSTNFASWQNGQNATATYSSGQVTNGQFDNVSLQSGTYYLIYDNTVGSTTLTIDSQANYYYIPP
jgi:hypothetical protein